MPHEINGVPLTPEMRQALQRKPLAPHSVLPPDFDDAAYLALHPDVGAAGMHPREHYVHYGYREGRAYKFPQAAGVASGPKPTILSALMGALKKSPR